MGSYYVRKTPRPISVIHKAVRKLSENIEVEKNGDLTKLEDKYTRAVRRDLIEAYPDLEPDKDYIVVVSIFGKRIYCELTILRKNDSKIKGVEGVIQKTLDALEIPKIENNEEN